MIYYLRGERERERERDQWELTHCCPDPFFAVTAHLFARSCAGSFCPRLWSRAVRPKSFQVHLGHIPRVGRRHVSVTSLTT